MKFLKEPAARATIVFVVIAVAMIVALWPRNGSSDDQASSPTSATESPTLPPVSDDEMRSLRADAALRSCPAGTGPAAPGSALTGVTVPCMQTGAPLDLGAATAGKPLVINMWAVWCLPCRKEMPLFDQFSQSAGERLNVLAVHAREGGDNQVFVLKFLAEVGVQVPVVTDPQGTIAKALGAPRIFPSTILVRADGTIAKVLPQVFYSEQQIADAVRENLGVDVAVAS
ncbi:TlpA family protein disulfide reductase [Gordonia hydrophobica]|uniref:TlpA disulfide reductase family protein n=1 Tax=Gordonia hydrophobica TaxID=40516 RepID=A0ABZ2U6N4_9ACTN|nr:TlpA disulfide reductase family protein [Gordonia hydrophobica]MBM7368391.1 thiol-disulfide isomerase/thioredoxin [Gordonia hydrophobica]